MEKTLHEIRTERQLKKRRIAALPAEARRELVSRKRQAHLERMLLPDAPTRKGHTKRVSPERKPCVLVADSMRSPTFLDVVGTVIDWDETIAASTSGVPCSSEPNPSGPVEAVASTSDAPCLEPAQASTSHSLEYYPVNAIFEYVDKVEPEFQGFPSTEGADVQGGDIPKHDSLPSEIGVQNQQFSQVFEKWLKMTNTPDSDDDDDNDDDCDLGGLTPTVMPRDALTEPCCDSDLSALENNILRREDDNNDRALRDILPEDSFTFSWSSDRETFLGRRETFTGTPGPTFVVTEHTKPIDIFDKIFDVDFIDLLVRETNRNAEQKIVALRKQNNLSTHSRFNRWTPTNRDEMVNFLAVIILQGLYPLPEEESYFNFNGFGTMPYFAKIMTCSRFQMLKTFLHFVDNETCQDRTRLAKIRPIIDFLNDKFSSLYMPSQDIAIDESLLKWHGRLSFSQKISTKAAKVGVKTYELCESSSGYLWKFFVYAGKAESTPLPTDGNDRQTDFDITVEDEDETNDDEPTTPTGEGKDRPTNATSKIVYDLIEPLLHRGHTVIMDNFYNSPLLLRSLKRQKTDCYGTLRLNREFVPDSVKTLTKTDLRQGEVVATYCSDLSIIVWRDANLVSMISTYHNLQIGTQDKNNRLTHKPSIVLDYNKSMGGVDRKDQFLAAQPMERGRNKIWYKKLFRRLYNAAIFNGFVIFTSANRKISHRKFRTVLAEELLKRHRQIDLTKEYREITRTTSTGQEIKTLRRTMFRPRTQAREIVESNHFPIRSETRYHCCVLCRNKRRTAWKCEQCDIHLCIDGCFKAYHKP